jgi:sugar phosphate isomerase/epimerase
MHDPEGGWYPQTYYDTAPATDAGLQAIVQSLDSFLELFATLHIPLAVLHVGGFTLVRAGASAEIALARRAASVDAIADAARRRGIRISIETMYFPQSGARTLEQIERIVAAAAADDLGICLDTGHANLAGVDLPTLVLRAAGSIDTLHLNDNDGRSDSHNVPREDGSVPWPAVLSSLRAAGYHGPVNLEVKGLEDAGIETRLHRLRKALDVARDIARQISGEAA